LIAQIAVAVSGILAIWMATSLDATMRRWAPLVGLAGQPGWLIATSTSEQWGMFAVSVAYTLVWARAGWREWA
jgi:hypothetical protein